MKTLRAFPRHLGQRIGALAFGLALVAGSGRGAARADEPAFTPLFDGKSLAGWKRLGGVATYHVEDGAIVGRTAPDTPNTFLVTEKAYADFILELEYLVDPGLNSGVQIRSLVRPNGRVGGYQVDIDPSPRAWSGGIYDESGRGWMHDLSGNDAARKAFRQGAWNHYRIECTGDSLRTWINGTPAADLVDSMTLEGFIGLQVHSYKGEEAAEVRWRNIRLRELGRHHWKPIWDGKTFTGWTREGGGTWRIEDGELIGANTRSEPRHGHLFSGAPLGDFTVRVEYKAVLGNSGLYFRTEKRGDPIGIAGFQAEIDAEKDAGGLYETGGRAWVVQPAPELVKRCFKPGDWNEMTVSARAGRIAVHVNGTKTAELRDDPGRRQGFLALQLHGGQDMEVRFRRVEILVRTDA